MRKSCLLFVAMVLTLVASSGTALAQDGATCKERSCWGTAGDDVNIGTPADNSSRGWGGDDLMLGFSGDDLALSGWGDDAVNGGKGNDLVLSSSGDDLVNGGKDNDLLSGGWGDDAVKGGKGNDRMLGGHGADLLEAHDGFSDRIVCGAGNRDLVFFDEGLDSVAADCETKRPTSSATLLGFWGFQAFWCKNFPRWC